MTKSGAKLLHMFILFCVVLSYTPLAFPQGQTNGAIQGRAYEVGTTPPVPLAGVIVTVTNRETGFKRTTVTGTDGEYLITTLPAGLYDITATATGYESEPLPDFPIRLGKINTVQPPPFGMRKVNAPTQASSTQPVEKTRTSSAQTKTESKAEQLTNTADATRGGNFDTIQLLSLPLPGIRTFDSLAFLLPGVAEPPESIGRAVGPGIGAGVGTSGQFSVNGNRSRANNFTIDGSDNNDQDIGVRRQGFVALIPQSIETLQEFRISTLLWDAELGRNPGSQVNAVTRGGSNDFHGQLYSFVTDSSLNARNAFDFEGGPSGGKDDNTRVQTGIAVGGPIVRNRTQFFTSFEYLHIGATSEQHFASPTADERVFQGGRRFSIVTPFGVGFTTTGATPLGFNVFRFYPLPNNPGGPYEANTLTRVLRADGNGEMGSLKLTHQVTSEQQLNGRYNATDDDHELPSIKRAIDSEVVAHTRTQDLSLILDSSPSGTLANQARFSFGRTRLNFFGANTTFRSTSSAQLPAFDPKTGADVGQFVFSSDTGPIGELDIEPFSPVGVDAFLFPQSRANNTFQYADTLSKRFGRHSFKVGADIRRVQLNSLQDRNYRPRVEFSTGLRIIVDRRTVDVALLSGAESAALGLASSVTQTLTTGPPDSTIGLRFTENNLFFNDNWRIRKNMTLDYGLRYEYNSVPHDATGRIERALRLENLPPTGKSTIGFLNGGLTDVFNAAVAKYREFLGGRTTIYDPDRNNFGPHVGFAWDPWSNGKTSIRGGYGLYYDTTLGLVVSQSRSVFPNEVPILLDPRFFPISGLLLNNPDLFGFNLPNGGRLKSLKEGSNQIGGAPEDQAGIIGSFFSQGGSGASGLSFTLPEKNLRTPYVHEWQVTIEREIVDGILASIAYVGTRGAKLTRLTTPNLGATVTPVVAASKDDFGRVLVNSADQFAFTRPESSLGAIRIFENKAKSDYQALQLEGRKRYSQGFTFTVAYTWSHAIDDVSDIVDTAGAFALPQDSSNLKAERGNASFDVRHRFAASMIWDLPFYRGSPDITARWLGGWQIASIFQIRSGQPYTLVLPFDNNLDGNLTDRPTDTKGLTFFDGHGSQRIALATGTDLFDLANGDTTIGRNTFRGDRFINLDVSLSKDFRFAENQKLELRSEFFNALNRANFGLPIRIIGAPGFGSSVDTVNPARVIQFALKYSF